jgi:hypothetical protein
MKNLGLLLIFAASLTIAADAPRPPQPAPQRAKMACTDALRPQMEADNAAAMQLKSTAYTEGLERGAAFGAGGALLLVALALRARKFQSGDRSSQERLSRAASA